MSASAILTHGLGSFGSKSHVLTQGLGFSAGGVIRGRLTVIGTGVRRLTVEGTGVERTTAIGTGDKRLTVEGNE